MEIPETSWLHGYWYKPSYIHMKYGMLARQLNWDEDRIKTEGRFKRVREMLAAADLACIVQHEMNECVHLQLDETESVDFFLMRSTHIGTVVDDIKITHVQHTAHMINEYRTQNIAEQLRSTKFKFNENPSRDYLLLVHTDQFRDKDIKAVKQLIKEKGILYKVFLMDGHAQSGDKNGRIAAFNAPFHSVRANFNDEMKRFPEAPALFNIRKSKKDNSLRVVQNRSQPYPWPDIDGISIAY